MSRKEKKMLDIGWNILALQKIYQKMEHIVKKASNIVKLNDMDDSPLDYLLKG